MHKWDKDQQQVIEAEPEARILVEAGPGTGKTAVACARVACLIRDWEVAPGNVLLLSFTRTAVAELRNRIGKHLENEHLAAAVRITTLDSATWHLLYGFDGQAEKLFGSYEANIEAVLEKIRTGDQDLLAHLAKYQHVIVDEAQDLTSLRAQLVVAIIGALGNDCGVTIFADPFQAIYGWTAEDGDSDGQGAVTLLDLLRSSRAAFRGLQLQTLYRTNEKNLAALMGSLREVLSTNGQPDAEQHTQLKSRLRDMAETIEHKRPDLPKHANGRSDLLILYRRRAEVLQTSFSFCTEGIRHRLRLSGLPVCIQPWVGRIFFDCRERQMMEDEFRTKWAERDCDGLCSAGSADGALSVLDRIGCLDRSAIDMRALRVKLARSRPPAEVCMVDCGFDGPILGTIHASKGREADTVYLFVDDATPKAAIEEESRVLYVGATRARRQLCVAKPGPVYAKTLRNSGRVFAIQRGDRSALLEIGRENDLEEWMTGSTQLHPDRDHLILAQDEIARRSDSISELKAVRYAESSDYPGEDTKYPYRLQFCDCPGDVPIGQLAQRVNADMFQVIKITGHQMKPPSVIRHIFSLGARTAVLGPDHPAIPVLQYPVKISGFLLVPIVRAWTMVSFEFCRWKKKW